MRKSKFKTSLVCFTKALVGWPLFLFAELSGLAIGFAVGLAIERAKSISSNVAIDFSR